MYTRYSKVVLVWAVAFYVSLVVFNNLADYGSNYEFVAHVLRMDTVFLHNRDSWRAIDTHFVYHAAYFLIIFVEALIAVLCWLGGFIALGGEWFLMWQSKIWNGQQAAFRLLVILGFTLLYLTQPDGVDQA